MAKDALAAWKLAGQNSDACLYAPLTNVNAITAKNKATWMRNITKMITKPDVFNAVIKEYKSYSSDDPIGQRQLREMLERVQQRFNEMPLDISGQVAFCIERFVSSELDFSTLGVRGLGRVGEHIPRLAAKHRYQFRIAESSDVDTMNHLIKRHLLCGYIFPDFFRELPHRNLGRYDNAKLFDSWVSGIYVNNASLEPEDQNEADLQNIWFASTGRDIASHATQLGIKWDSSDTVSSDQTIITYYFSAGIKLRYMELDLSN